MTLRDFVEFGVVLGIASRRELESFETEILTGAAIVSEDGGDGSAVDDNYPFSHWFEIFLFARRVFASRGLRL